MLRSLTPAARTLLSRQLRPASLVRWAGSEHRVPDHSEGPSHALARHRGETPRDDAWIHDGHEKGVKHRQWYIGGPYHAQEEAEHAHEHHGHDAHGHGHGHAATSHQHAPSHHDAHASNAHHAPAAHDSHGYDAHHGDHGHGHGHHISHENAPYGILFGEVQEGKRKMASWEICYWYTWIVALGIIYFAIQNHQGHNIEDYGEREFLRRKAGGDPADRLPNYPTK